MSNGRLYTRAQLCQEYDFPTVPARDFERDGFPAQYASGHPLPPSWHSHSEAIDFREATRADNKEGYRSFHGALSSDQKLLAISSAQERIAIYDVASKELRAILEGSGSIAFRPVLDPVHNGYTLVSSIADLEARGARPGNRLILWDLDQHGRLLVEEEPIDTATIATQAIDAILPHLISEHEWTKEFAEASSLRADFEKALSRVAADHRRRHHTILHNARLGGCGSSTFSDDGRLLLYHSQNDTTQRSMRDPEKLPRVIVYDLDGAKEVHNLHGHTDSIMWSAISPDHQHVASVSWDGTLRMYSADSGDLEWVTYNKPGQAWAGAFTPDSKHIIWSSKNGSVIRVHQVSDSRLVSEFQGELDDWCRHFTWHPTGEKVALAGRKYAYVWCPFDGPDGSIAQHFRLDSDSTWRNLASIHNVSWMEKGEMLALEFSEGTKLVYNLQYNSKELFIRPKGVEPASVNSGFYGVLSGPDQPEFYLSVDGDGKVRYCRTSVPAGPSWWEKEPEKRDTTPSTKKLYPETGKYVKVTKVSRKDTPDKDAGRVSWAEKGAELWTAE
jgi:WD40 repeat protein